MRRDRERPRPEFYFMCPACLVFPCSCPGRSVPEYVDKDYVLACRSCQLIVTTRSQVTDEQRQHLWCNPHVGCLGPEPELWRKLRA